MNRDRVEDRKVELRRQSICDYSLTKGNVLTLLSFESILRDFVSYIRPSSSIAARTYAVGTIGMPNESRPTRMNRDTRCGVCVSNRFSFHNLHATCRRSSLPLCQSCRVFFYFSECSRQGRHDHRGDA